MHHKYCDTDADPMNPKRGFFFSHFGWMLVEPHPMVMEKIDVLDLSDITSDELVMFQHRFTHDIDNNVRRFCLCKSEF